MVNATRLNIDVRPVREETASGYESDLQIAVGCPLRKNIVSHVGFHTFRGAILQSASLYVSNYPFKARASYLEGNSIRDWQQLPENDNCADADKQWSRRPNAQTSQLPEQENHRAYSCS